MPNDLWAIIMLICLVGWISSTLVFLFKAFPEQGVFNAKPAKTWGCAVLVFYGIWVLGMFMA